jgi:hypothetical protein
VNGLLTVCRCEAGHAAKTGAIEAPVFQMTTMIAMSNSDTTEAFSVP